MIKRVLCICGIALMGLPFLASSTELALDEQVVTRYVQSLRDILPVLQTVERSEPVWDGGLPDGLPPMLDVAQMERGSDLYRQLNSLTQKHGFAGLDQWNSLGQQIWLTRLYIQEREDLDSVYEQLDALEVALRDNARQYSTAELEQLMRTFQASKNHILRLIATRSDVPPVQAHLAELDAALASLE
ncbi:hypothetical protein [Alcaligenes parafaecalis]|uniref:Uncharacterized protein n=1 Tax=Alcaligenes parafaecalis TaxID=171260 RepID=A0ABT3VR51_9BURK|nr:hypothetical protein [Alcaligenes parafaecalis]MCX5464909.1 hypothetical protein [Alcaligenes parafaecalis]